MLVIYLFIHLFIAVNLTQIRFIWEKANASIRLAYR